MLNIAVLRGGPSSEYDVSLQSGQAVLAHLPDHRYLAHDILIGRDGTWHRDGVPVHPEHALRRADVVFNALHGEYGEDGKLQQLLDRLRIPYTGSRSLPSAIAMNKAMSKEMFKKAGIKTPHSRLVRQEEDVVTVAKNLFNTFPQPCVIKPTTAGSSVGVSIAQTLPELIDALSLAHRHGDALVEEWIAGKEATCGVIENFRGANIYALLPVEIVPKNTYFDYESKYGGQSQELCPGRFTPEEKKEIEHLARLAHEVLGLHHYSRADFIVSPRRGVYLLEVNTQPGLTRASLFPKSLEAVGVTFPDFLEHLISLAMSRK